MEGVVLDFNEAKGKGIILGKDSERYSFTAKEVKGDSKISNGSKVDFVTDGDSAKDIYEAAAAIDSKFMKDKSLEVGKEALNIGKDVAAKAGSFFSSEMMKEIFAFNTMITPKIISFVYWIALFSAAVAVIYGIFNVFGGVTFGKVLVAPVIFVAWVLGTRILFELLILPFKIHENSKRMVELLSELKDK